MGVYGFYFWVKGGKIDKNKKKVPIRNLPLKKYFVLFFIGFTIYWIIVFLLKNYTDSKVPYIDSLISSLAIIATIMMIRKFKQHWLVWVISDVFSISLFIYQGMYAAMAMYIFMMVSSIIGFVRWSREMKKQEKFQNETVNKNLNFEN
jgi:nicotinamide mononucleotide transporter